MKFFEGVLMGSLITVGASYLCNDIIPKNKTKKMFKKGKQLIKHMRIF